MVQVWWVNQSTRKGEAANEIVWAPDVNKAGNVPWHWETLNRVAVDDLIYHYTDGFIVGTSVSTGPAVPSGNPYVSSASSWNEIGKRVPVDYLELEVRVARDDIPSALRRQDAPKSGPFDKRGQVSQGYLFPVSAELWRELARLTGFGGVVAEVALNVLLDVNGPTDVIVRSIRRREQRQIRERLLNGRTVAPCGLCNKSTPAEYLVAGHIKQRSAAKERERLDLRNVMLVCVFGCDKAFEIGDARVDGDGVISVSGRLKESRPEYFKEIHGRTAPSFNAASSRYFAERHKSFQ